MFASLIFIFNRVLQLLTLIPTIGMLGYFVDYYNKNKALTPTYILFLFIVAVLAAAWALATLVRRDSTRRNSILVALIDAGFMGTLIAAVYELRAIARADCANVSGGFSSSGGVTTGDNSITLSPLHIDYSPFDINVSKTCAMLKASFAFGIINVVLFATTALMALFLHRHDRGHTKEVYRTRSHGSRRGHSHRSRSHSRSRYYV